MAIGVVMMAGVNRVGGFRVKNDVASCIQEDS